MTLFGIDVSKYQASLDWTKVTGEAFMFARASIGPDADPYYAGHVLNAKKDDLLTGAYHYLVPGDGAKQCDTFLSITGDTSGMLAAVDAELYGITYATLKAFADRFAQRTSGHPLFVYTRANVGGHILAGNPLPGLLWLSYYPDGGYPGDSDPTWHVKVGGQTATIWQYGPAHVAGDGVDGDAYRGTLAQLTAYAGGSSSDPNAPGDTVTVVTQQPYAAPRSFSSKAGLTQLRRFTATAEVPPIPAPYSSSVDADVGIDGTGPHGPVGSYLRLSAGGSAGMFILAAEADVAPAPDPCAAEVKTAVNKALDHVAAPAGATLTAIDEARIR